jgi:CBS domain-containing protein
MGLKHNLQYDLVGDLPIRDVVIVDETTPVRDVIAALRVRRLGVAIVVDAAGHPLGSFTERTILDVLLRDPAAIQRDTVGPHVYRKTVFLTKKDPLAAVWDAVVHRGMRFVGVVDENGTVIGVTGQKGLSEYIAEHYPQQVMVQRIGGKPGLEQREGA